MRVDFYLLQRCGAETALPPLAAKVLQAGGRLLAVSGDERQRAALSEALWTQGRAGFLANGMAGGDHDARQPILISDLMAPANGARYLALADGVWREPDVGVFDRILLIFGDAARDAARDVWRDLRTRDGVESHFWRQEDGGRWAKAG